MISLSDVSARTTIRNARVVIEQVSFEEGAGVLGIVGTEADGTSLVLDVLDGTTKPRAGRVLVFGGGPEAARARIARVSIDAPLPEELTVAEVAELDVAIRRGRSAGERKDVTERLSPLGIGMLAGRRVRSLSVGERRAVALALALGSGAELVLVEEPLVAMDPVATRLVIDAIRQRATSASIVVTTASARDAMRLADRVGVLTKGQYAPRDPGRVGESDAGASMRIVVAPSAGKAGAAAIAGDLSSRDVVSHVEVSAYAPTSGAVALFVSGPSLLPLAKAVTNAIAVAGVEVELVETSALSLDAFRAATAATASPVAKEPA